MASILMMLTVAVAGHSDSELAIRDRAQFAAEVQPYIFHVTTSTADEELQKAQELALRFIIPSVSRQQILERCMPFKVGPTLYRLNLIDLQWDLKEWYKVIAQYPYNPTGSKYSTVLRADWLLLTLTDQQEANAYYPLLFGKTPKNRDEALAILKVGKDPKYFFGMIEGQSQVAVNKYRRIENRPIERGYAYGTNDYLNLDEGKDPLEHPEKQGPHDGEEWIIGLPKIHLKTGTRGALQVYFLANGKGGIVNRAPADLVHDYTKTRGLNEIRNPISCINCHNNGLNFPIENSLRSIMDSGVELHATYPANEEIERFHLGDLNKEIKRDNEDYEAIIKAGLGVPPAEATAAFIKSIDAFDKRLDLETVAREVYMTPKETQSALDWMSHSGRYYLGPRFPAIRKQGIPRDVFQSYYFQFRQGIEAWRQTQ